MQNRMFGQCTELIVQNKDFATYMLSINSKQRLVKLRGYLGLFSHNISDKRANSNGLAVGRFRYIITNIQGL